MTDEQFQSEQHFQAYLEKLGTTAKIDRIAGAAIYQSLPKSSRDPHANEPRVKFQPDALLVDTEKSMERLKANLEDVLSWLNSINRPVNTSEKTNAVSMLLRSKEKLESYVRDGFFLVKHMEAVINASKIENLRRPIAIREEKPYQQLKAMLTKILFALQVASQVDQEQSLGLNLDPQTYEPFLTLFPEEIANLANARKASEAKKK